MNAITSVNASGTGDMLKATYDPNGDGIVSQAASANFVQWTNISGRPTMSGTNTGDQTITLTGDVTGTGTGSFTATVANGAVTLAKQANLAANSIIGNNTGTAATPIAMTATQAKALLAIAQSDVTGLTAALSGLTPTSRTINGRALSADIVLQNELVQGYREKTQVSTITTVFNFTTYLASGFTSFYLTGTIGQNLTFTMPAVSAANESLSFQVFFKQPATAVTVAWGGTAPTFINGTYAAPASTKGQLLTFTSVNGSPWYGITANTADIS
jgi:hypothetical protein